MRNVPPEFPEGTPEETGRNLGAGQLSSRQLGVGIVYHRRFDGGNPNSLRLDETVTALTRAGCY
jgi:hypothetical protein